MIKRKYVVGIAIACLIFIVVYIIWLKAATLDKVDYLEMQMNPMTEISENEKNIIKTELDKYLVNDSTGYYFSELGMSLTNNPYSLYYLYYDYLLLNEMELSTELIENNILYLETALMDAVANQDICAMDVVAGICLQKLVTGKYDERLLDYFNRHYYDDTKNLYSEIENDTISSDVAFTIDICSMFDEANIEYNVAIKKSVEEYFEGTQFVKVNDAMTIYSAGGDSLYAMNAVGNEINISQEIRDWYVTWREKCPSEVTSWEDVITIECIYKPVADAVEDDLSYAAIDGFIRDYNNIMVLISEGYEERMAYDLLKNHIWALSDDGKNALAENLFDHIDAHLDELKRISMRSTFYGMQLCYIVSDDEYDFEKLMQSVSNYYVDITSQYIDGESILFEQVINDTYYYLMLDYQQNEGSYSEKTIKYVNSVLQITTGQISNIKDPVTLRRFCTIMSQIDKKIFPHEKKLIKQLYESFMQNVNIMSSYYIVDLYIVGEIMGFNDLSDAVILTCLDNLCLNGCYCNSSLGDGTITLESTFNVYALIACCDELGTVYDQNQVMFNTIKNDFRLDDGTYTPYKGYGAAKLYTLYWAICLTSI